MVTEALALDIQTVRPQGRWGGFRCVAAIGGEAVNIVTFRRGGGTTHHLATGREAKLRGTDKVYRLRVRVHGKTRVSAGRDTRVSVRDSGSYKSGIANKCV